MAAQSETVKINAHTDTNLAFIAISFHHFLSLLLISAWNSHRFHFFNSSNNKLCTYVHVHLFAKIDNCLWRNAEKKMKSFYFSLASIIAYPYRVYETKYVFFFFSFCVHASQRMGQNSMFDVHVNSVCNSSGWIIQLAEQ